MQLQSPAGYKHNKTYKAGPTGTSYVGGRVSGEVVRVAGQLINSLDPTPEFLAVSPSIVGWRLRQDYSNCRSPAQMTQVALVEIDGWEKFCHLLSPVQPLSDSDGKAAALMWDNFLRTIDNGRNPISPIVGPWAFFPTAKVLAEVERMQKRKARDAAKFISPAQQTGDSKKVSSKCLSRRDVTMTARPMYLTCMCGFI